VKRERLTGERDDRWVLLGGERGGGGVSWVGSVRGGLGQLASRGWPKWAPGLSFFCFLFPFVLISVLSFEKALLFRFK
jgi:hypothetical protein